MPRKSKSAVPTTAPPAPTPSVSAKSALRITARDDEPCRREVFDVEYSVHGEQVADRGFLTREAAEAHAALIREAYGL